MNYRQHLISATNHRLQVAIMVVRIMGRRPETMAEVYDARNDRAARRERRLTKDEENKLNRKWMAENAPDLIRKGVQ